jgi:ribosome-binding factor A
MNSRRQQRVAELIREEIATILTRKVSDPRVAMVSVTDVQVSPDLQIARVFVSAIGDDDARQLAMKGLDRAKPFIRHELATRVELRQVPELVFRLDEAVERGARVENLLRQIEEEQRNRTGEPPSE